MTNYDYDVICVGCGHGCDLAARILARAGKKVAAIERDLWMGTCTNYGCNAKILLDGPFELTTAMENYREIGVFDKVPEVNWEKLMQYKLPYFEAVKPLTKANMEQSGCVCIHGEGKLKDAHTVVARMEKKGAQFKYCEDVCAIEKTATGLLVKTEKGFEVECDYVLQATGRPVNYEGLGLEALGIETGPRGIKVDDHLRTSVKNIFAAGDAIDKRIPKLTPTALFESQYIADLIMGKTTEPICYPVVPNLVFTFPRIAQVGVSLDAARKDDRYRVVDVPYGQAFLFNTHNEAYAKLAFIFDRESNLLVGAAAMGSDAGAWIDVLSLVIFNKMTREQFTYYIYAFPTTTCGPLMMLGQLW